MVKRLIQGLLVAALISGSLGSSVLAGVEDFEFDSLSVEFRLSRDENRRSVLDVKETFVAVFPNFDQNRGIVREIPLTYQGHPLNLTLGEIYRDGELLKPAADSTEDGVRRLELRRGNQYVHGAHTYEINYRLHDVILSPDDTQAQELYWDVNGTNWRQPFGSVQATLILADDLSEALTGRMACYTGIEGSSEQSCTISRGDINSVDVSATRDFAARENLTFAVEFVADTFAPYEMKPVWANLAKGGSVAAGLALVILIVMTIRWIKLANGEKIQGAVVTQYLPPEGIDVMEAATLLKKSNGPSATLIDLAVRHQINISEVKPQKSFFGLSGRPDYKLEVVSTDKLSANDEAVLKSFLQQKTLEVGAMRILSRAQPDESLPSRLLKVANDTFRRMRKNGFYQASKKLWRPIIGWLFLSLAVGGLVASLVIVSEVKYSAYSSYLTFAGAATLIWSIVLIVSFATARPKTQRGAEAYHYLQGLKQYIKLAEADRLAFLQGVDTAQTAPGAKSEAERRVILYERVLPYAVLFGLEKSWSKVLEATYQEANIAPTWFIGAQPFSASSFASSVSSFSSYSSSSSSSGSGGGGSSGGGGGGGGGGGC